MHRVTMLRGMLRGVTSRPDRIKFPFPNLTAGDNLTIVNQIVAPLHVRSSVRIISDKIRTPDPYRTYKRMDNVGHKVGSKLANNPYTDTS